MAKQSLHEQMVTWVPDWVVRMANRIEMILCPPPWRPYRPAEPSVKSQRAPERTPPPPPPPPSPKS